MSPANNASRLSQPLSPDTFDAGFGPIPSVLADLSNDTTSIHVAAISILSSLAAHFDANPEEYAYTLSTHIQNLALSNPSLQPRLASLIANINGLPDTHSSACDLFLSTFTHCLSDLSQGLYGILLEKPHHLDATTRKKYEHVSAFQALLLAKLEGSAVIDRTEALWTLSVGLEEHPDSHDDVDIDGVAAAMWMIHASGVVWRSCKEGPEPGLVPKNMTVRGRLWTGQSGFSVERWNFWMRRFDQIMTMAEDVDSHTREMAATALRAMKEAEGKEKE